LAISEVFIPIEGKLPTHRYSGQAGEL
jgi:hypothetical protein